MEKCKREATNDIVEESKDPLKDDYFEHLKGGLHINLDKVTSDEEKSHSSEEDTKALNKRYIIETSNQELEEKLSQQLKEVGEKVGSNKNLFEEKVDTDVNVEILEEPPLIGQDKGPIQEEEVPLEKEEEEKEEDKEEDALGKSLEPEHHDELEQE